MGKQLIQQRRGRGSIFRAPSFNYKGDPKLGRYYSEPKLGTITDLVHCAGHSAPLARIDFEGESVLMIAPEGVRIGDTIFSGPTSAVATGNILALKDIPEGTAIFNVEAQPGDGGKMARAGGTFATLLQKAGTKVTVQLPSKKTRIFDEKCRAAIGRIAGGGRLEKPRTKAGVSYYAKKARRKNFPNVRGLAMNAVAHPYGKKRSSKKGKVTIAPRNAPPGRKVGKIRPRRTGKKR